MTPGGDALRAFQPQVGVEDYAGWLEVLRYCDFSNYRLHLNVSPWEPTIVPEVLH